MFLSSCLGLGHLDRACVARPEAHDPSFLSVENALLTDLMFVSGKEDQFLFEASVKVGKSAT